MSIRTKFFALAGILLMLFACVVGILSVFQKDTEAKLSDITVHHQPLRRLVADLDVQTDEYELLVHRLYVQPNREDAKAIAERIDRLAEQIREHFKYADSILQSAIDQNMDDPADLRVLSYMGGALPYIERQVEPFTKVGGEATAAILDGSPDAREKLVRFMQFENAFGPDLAAIRTKLAELTEKGTKQINSEQQVNVWLSFGLFVVASVVGLGISGIGSGQVVSALRKLLESTKRMESGKTDLLVPVVTKDEVGELAQAFNRMVKEIEERDRLKETFGKFLDPRIVKKLTGSSTEINQLAERKNVTIFFSDIEGFSGISEQLTPQAMVNLLNEYFAAVAEEIRAKNGIIDKYIGDAVMAFWCEPFSATDEHAVDGCRAALAQLRAVENVRNRLSDITGLRRNTPNLVVRMGLATGEVVVGVVGSPNSRSYTVIGDTVNTASRLEGVNKVYHTSIIIAEDTYRLVSHTIEARELDIVTLTGKSEPTRIYELLAEKGKLEGPMFEMRAVFMSGLAAYRERDWDEAQKEFEACLEHHPTDGPSAVFLKRIAAFREEPPPDDWGGVWHLKAK